MLSIVNSQSPITYNQYKYFAILAMLYVSISICSLVLTYKLVSWPVYAQAGNFVKPLWFVMSDIIAEIYGLKLSRLMIFLAFMCQVLFVIVCEFLITLPSPSLWHHQEAYNFVFGKLWLVLLSGFVAYFVAGFVNVEIISRWKAIVSGKYFAIRSIGSSAISEFLFSFISIFIIQIGQTFDGQLKIATSSFLLKLVYSLILAFPATHVMMYIRKMADITDYNTLNLDFESLKSTIKE